MKGPDLIGMEDLTELLEMSNSSTIKEIVDPIRNAMNLFEKNISTMAFLPDVSRITLRTATLQFLLNRFREEVKGKRYEEVLRKAGEIAGESFACDLINFLIKHNKLAKNERVLMNLWQEFDNIAGWGKFNIDYKGNDKIVVDVEDNFLTRELDEDKHRHCAFMMGYVEGFLWTALKEHYRLFERMVVVPSNPPRTVFKIASDCGRDSCRFIAELRPEQLQGAFESFYDSKNKLREGKLDEAARLLRTSVELAFKEKIGLDKNDSTSVLQIADSFKEKNIPLKYRVISDIYASTSRVVHGSKRSSKEKIAEFQSKWNDILKDLELLDLK